MILIRFAIFFLSSKLFKKQKKIITSSLKLSIKNLASNCKNADYSFGPSDSTRRIPRRKHFQPNINPLRNSVTRKNVGNYSRIDTTVLRAASCHSVSSDTRKNLQFHPNLRRPSRRVEFKKSWTRFLDTKVFTLEDQLCPRWPFSASTFAHCTRGCYQRAFTRFSVPWKFER